MLLRGFAEDDSNGLHSRILSTFLNELDGTALRENEEEGGITVLVAAQSLVHLDDALLRPGRLSHHVYLGPPSTSDVLDILRHKLKDFPLAADLDIAIIAAELSVKRPSCADVESICKEAVMDAVREIITASESSQENEESALLTQCVSSGMSCLKFSNFARAFTLHFGVAPSF